MHLAGEGLESLLLVAENALKATEALANDRAFAPLMPVTSQTQMHVSASLARFYEACRWERAEDESMHN